ncbi:hypothetical protein J6590_007776 [Homalodisca vitripennis]|nr:hypothetical protein J6590_007776 [Homalodisca vitripennis]
MITACQAVRPINNVFIAVAAADPTQGLAHINVQRCVPSRQGLARCLGTEGFSWTVSRAWLREGVSEPRSLPSVTDRWRLARGLLPDSDITKIQLMFEKLQFITKRSDHNHLS